jgi:hypothetical protein
VSGLVDSRSLRQYRGSFRLGIRFRRKPHSLEVRALAMISVVQSVAFSEKCKGKFSTVQIDELVERIASDPKSGHKLEAANCVYRLPLPASAKRKQEYDAYYVYHASRSPVLIVNIFRRGENDVLTKTVATLSDEICRFDNR